MAERYLRLIPVDPSYMPGAVAQSQVLAVLGSMVGADTPVDARLTKTLEFVDQGELFTGLSCPQCTAKLDMDWWQSAMDAAYERNFSNLMVETPCCHERVSLNDLVYEAPAGFSRFVIEVDVSTRKKFALSDEQLYDLSQILGTELKQIIAEFED